MKRNRTDRSHFLGLAVALLGLTLAACGAESETGSESATGSAEASLIERVLVPRAESVTVPAGTLLVVRFQNGLSSHESKPGDRFWATIEQDVSIAGKLAVPAGSRIAGQVTEAAPAKKIGGRARLSLAFRQLELPSGATLPLSASFAQQGRSERAKDAAIIGGSTLGGAILGEAVDEGEGTWVGAVVGGLAGTAAAKKTLGKPVVVEAGAVMTLELGEALTVVR